MNFICHRDFKLRREQLLRAIGSDDIVIIFSAKIVGGTYPYRENSDFYYLTGFIEPEAIAVLIPSAGGGEFILFSREGGHTREVWDGPCFGQKKAKSRLGADQAYAISEVATIIPKFLAKPSKIYSNVDSNHNFDGRISSWLKQASFRQKIRRKKTLIDVGKILHELRLKKSCAEMISIRKATAITARGHLRAMQQCRPHMYEFELQAEILHEFMRLGGCYPAFPTIVAAGANACTLHYSRSSKKLIPGELVLIDAGAEYEHYCADLSRTFPVNGKFTYNQRSIYEIVLAAQLEVIKQVHPGVSWDQLQATAERVIVTGLVEARLLQGEIKTLLAEKKFTPFFMHKVGHWLGLDVHDVGEYRINNEWCTLESGMVFTLEPGIYVAPGTKHSNSSSRYSGIGVRIEDDILVTDHGCEVLTENVPKSVAAIEKMMK